MPEWSRSSLLGSYPRGRRCNSYLWNQCGIDRVHYLISPFVFLSKESRAIACDFLLTKGEIYDIIILERG